MTCSVSLLVGYMRVVPMGTSQHRTARKTAHLPSGPLKWYGPNGERNLLSPPGTEPSDVRKSVHHHTIQIIQSTRCNSFTSLLLDVYVWLNRPGSVVGIATGYGLDGPGIEYRWAVRFSAPVQTGPGAHPASCTMGTGSFPGVKSGRGVTLTPHPLLVPWS
jgi:hypothetical protein